MGRRFGIAVLAVSLALLVACSSPMAAPARFSAEIYDDCSAIKKALNTDYTRLARRRFDDGKNVFVYVISPLGSGPPLYAGLNDSTWNLTPVARAAIAKGGSWGVSYPDTGCSNIENTIGEDYAQKYNVFALTLYTKKK